MHGRLKVKSTAEQLEAKRKEREKKLQIYNAATSKIFGKKRKGELDEELLTLTGEVLAVNPDFYSLWNFRKETFLELQNTKDKDALQSMFQSELHFLESCLKINPKSYGTWHHRCFVMDTMPEPDWGRELQLCNQFLQYDERNFHCWDYRRYVVRRANVSPESEFEYSMSKISNNFSNYSSWHYRSKLLPILFPDPSQPMGVSESALLKEYELVQNGFFTDPDDQSNWFYHRWLMGRGDQKQAINLLFVSRAEKRVLLSFALPVQVGAETSIVVDCDGSSLLDVVWHNQDRDDTFSTLWISEGVDFPDAGACAVTVKVMKRGSETMTSSVTLGETEDHQVASHCSDCKTNSRFSQELSAVKSETLQQELESVSQLMEMETDNKWAVLTVVLLMKALDPVRHKEDISKHLDTLIALDLKRVNYYRDLKSKFCIENVIEGEDFSRPGRALKLSSSNLTKLYHPELLPLVADLDLSCNSLHEVRHFGYLQSLKRLNLGENRLQTCEGLGGLPRLELVSLKNNDIGTLEGLRPLLRCPVLKTLDVSGNPVCSSTDFVDSIQKMLPNVHVICS
ncbi:geranylgeranyl transferase type-2 subunit alpha isoform X2 [Aplysia californica]|uniref:Geranylgeranyl transferase type-2 subunit alpha n=1 Tax=Aplysia californica TaxID=6500 RepID=A0ABM1W4X6_APLCA|nr:geranylgeranyl transferase type-2 subunit alpha isoform X2 [Aplysia californica]XP_035829719.1 geranylgeranyl transferase type-2 subunit alpha isoform X2 [Aplysia californica]